jgi:hypothetical protein
MKARDLTDPNSRTEYDAYEKLVKEFQQIAVQLQATADQWLVTVIYPWVNMMINYWR